MSEPWLQKLRRWLHNPIPRRVETSVAVWWEWGGRTHRLKRKDGRLTAPPAPPWDTTGKESDDG